MSSVDPVGCQCRGGNGDSGGGGPPPVPGGVAVAAVAGGDEVDVGVGATRSVDKLRAVLAACAERLAEELAARQAAEESLAAARAEVESLREALRRAGEQARAERDARMEACSVAGRLADEQGRVASALEAVLLAHVLGRHAPHPARGHRPGWEARRPDGSGEPLGWYASQAEALAAVRSAAGCGDDRGG